MRIAIAGGSMAGLFAATLLQRLGHEVLVFERSAVGLQGRGAGLIAQQEVFDLLHVIGRDDVADGGVVAGERITLDRGGAVVRRDAQPQVQISWDHLYLAARTQLDADQYLMGLAVVAAGQDADSAWLVLSNGTRIEADLVIGADGVGSAVRRAMIGADPGPDYAGYVAWRALVPERCLPAPAAHVLSDHFAFYHMPGGQALGYTVAGPRGELEKGQRRFNAVWYRRTDDLASTLTDPCGRVHRYSLPPGAVSTAAAAKLRQDADTLLPLPFAQVFAVERTPFVQAIFDMEARRMVHGRMALIGDAAFVARPHTAMGVAKAAGDAMALAAAIWEGWTPASRATFETERLAAGRAVVEYGKRLGASLQ